MSALKCVKCGTFRFLGGSCTHCSGKEKQNEQSPNSGAASHDSKGKETGQKLSTTQELQEKILSSNGNAAAFYARQASAVGGNPTAGQFRFPYNLAEYGHYPLPGSNFGSAQSIATNQMEAIAHQQQMFHYFQSVMALQQLAIVNRGQNRDFYLQSMLNMSVLGPAPTFGNVAPPLRVPAAAASIANYFLPGPSSQSFEGHILQSVAERTTNPRFAFCLMCEKHFENIETHKTKFHPDFENSLGRSDFSCFISYFEGKRICYYRGTCFKELKTCPICQNVFYKYRCYHHGCPVQIDIPDLPIANLLTAQPLKGYAPGTEYCLMCKSFFDNVHQHWSTLHFGNNNYTTRLVYGQMTLFPIVNQLDDLCKCKICYQLKHEKKFSPHLFLCKSCFKNIHETKSRLN